MCNYCVACCICIRLENDKMSNPSPSDVIHSIDDNDCECRSCDNSFCEYHWEEEKKHGYLLILPNVPYEITKCSTCRSEE